MKKYMILALLPALLQGELYGTSKSLNSMIENELQSARDLMHLRIELNLEKIVDELIRYAKIGDVQYTSARMQLALIKSALERKRSEQYDTAWSKFMWAFGKYPDFVVTDIDPAIKMINEADRSIYITKMSQYASDVAYAGSRSLALWLALSAAVSAGVLISGGLSNKNSVTSESNIPVAQVIDLSDSHPAKQNPRNQSPQPTAPVDDNDEWFDNYGSNPFA